MNEKESLLKQSWKRCQNLGFDRYGKPISYRIKGSQLEEVLGKNTHIIKTANTVFQRLDQFLKNYQYKAYLLDYEGYILHSYGVKNELETLNHPDLSIGACWAESFRGTNAVSFSIEHKTPVNIHEGEHFFYENRILTCSASPIFDENGKVIAVVNFSSRSNNLNDHALMLAMLTAEAIQYRIANQKVKIENEILLSEIQVIGNYLNQPYISINSDQQIVYANSKAKKFLGNHCIGTRFSPSSSLKAEYIHQSSHLPVRKAYILKPTNLPSPSKRYDFDQILAHCSNIKQVVHLAKKAANTEFSIFINGESGTGKELFAQSIHEASPRATQPFIAVNCSSLSENLIESELFGYKKGAFTGADNAGSLGKFRAANGGTIFLDEIGDMSLQSQSSLLRVLEEREVMPVGDHRTYPVDIRIIAATHRNLIEEIEKGKFRADLYYRLNEISIQIPALRDRDDVIELAKHFLTNLSGNTKQFTDEAIKALQIYHWPGNIRELKNVISQACFLSEGGFIKSSHLRLEQTKTNNFRKMTSTPVPNSTTLTLEEVERILIEQALEINKGNVTQAAKQLGVTRNTLYRKLKVYRDNEK
ncbi:sigma-54-dependent Fis family transcriptional regulator [Priestia filamentosa]|uniref:sigma-54-dependent Fis family transcriptional regulator n=1 Tax=Priestia filamentosa TaxID=1402861 RepID=UPI001C1DF2FE|nr:sigma-54-dependent Fis family transcriptional regulator [Priestia filamentosa]